jgi:hypothetical protein
MNGDEPSSSKNLHAFRRESVKANIRIHSHGNLGIGVSDRPLPSHTNLARSRIFGSHYSGLACADYISFEAMRSFLH